MEFRRNIYYNKFEILTAVLLAIKFFWDVTPYRLVNGYRPFGNLYCNHIQIHAVGVLYSEGTGVVLWRYWCCTLKVLVLYSEGTGVVLWRYWCCILKVLVLYSEGTDVVLWRYWCCTLKVLVFYSESTGVLLWRYWCCTLKVPELDISVTTVDIYRSIRRNIP